MSGDTGVERWVPAGMKRQDHCCSECEESFGFILVKDTRREPDVVDYEWCKNHQHDGRRDETAPPEHTPGPWTLGEDGRGVWGTVDGVARRLLDVRRTGELARNLLEREANARLAAAAPEMLDALRQWQAAEQTDDAEELSNARSSRDRAIKAATGGAS